jgi:hypothetical protein
MNTEQSVPGATMPRDLGQHYPHIEPMPATYPWRRIVFALVFVALSGLAGVAVVALGP